MDDSISRRAMQEIVDRIGGMYPYRQIGNRESYSSYNEAWTDCISRVDAELNSLPSAEQQEKVIYSTMSDKEFEEWLRVHGICHPDIHEPIPCSAVPLLIDDAINELPSTEPEQRWIPVSKRLPEENMWTICQNDAGAMMIGKYDIEFGWMFPAYFDGIVAWKPLPEPYRAERRTDEGSD